jgi:hypothetical protein
MIALAPPSSVSTPSSATTLTSFELHQCSIDESSWKALSRCFSLGASLRELHVVIQNSIESTACRQAVESILGSCERLSSLTFVCEHDKFSPSGDPNLESLLPWKGIKQAAVNTNNYCGTGSPHGSKGSCMTKVCVAGGVIDTEADLQADGLCGALRGFDDHALHRVVTTIQNTRPPLSVLDLSYNQIRTEGAIHILELLPMRNIVRNFTLLSLEGNLVDVEGGIAILTQFGKLINAAENNGNIEVRLDGNPFDLTSVSLRLAGSVAKAESEMHNLREGKGSLQVEVDELIGEMQVLRDALVEAMEERDALAKALSVLGSANLSDRQEPLKQAVHADRFDMLERITKLERMVLGQFGAGNTFPAFQPGPLPSQGPSFTPLTPRPSTDQFTFPTTPEAAHSRTPLPKTPHFGPVKVLLPTTPQSAPTPTSRRRRGSRRPSMTDNGFLNETERAVARTKSADFAGLRSLPSTTPVRQNHTGTMRGSARPSARDIYLQSQREHEQHQRRQNEAVPQSLSPRKLSTERAGSGAGGTFSSSSATSSSGMQLESPITIRRKSQRCPSYSDPSACRKTIIEPIHRSIERSRSLDDLMESNQEECPATDNVSESPFHGSAINLHDSSSSLGVEAKSSREKHLQ